MLPIAIRAAAVQIDENIARFGAFAWADDAAILQFIHDAGGAGVTEAQAALHERNAGFLFAANDFDALLDQFLVFVAAAALLIQAARRAWKAAGEFPFRSSACPACAMKSTMPWISWSVISAPWARISLRRARAAGKAYRPCPGACRRPWRREWCGNRLWPPLGRRCGRECWL